jgi:tetratricopeptide (TPR) repeat protein
MKRKFLLLSSLLLLGGLAAPAPAAPPSETDKKLVAEVSQQLMKKMDRVPGYDAWPPSFEAYDGEKEGPRLRFNAYAWIDQQVWKRDKKLVPIVRISDEYLNKIVKGDRDVLAYILGHELGHHHHRHVLEQNPGKTELTIGLFSRKREEDADVFGADLAGKADFSVVRGAALMSRRLYDLYRHGSPIGALASTHPAWSERFGKITQDTRVWEALATFDNGVALLNAEKFYAAEKCFEKVLGFDRACYEAHVNLGYAKLMQYCDKLDEKDLRKMGIGQVLCGAFYRRPKSIEPPVRGIDKQLWLDAVASLRDGLNRKPGLALAHANLGLAHLVHPDGRDAARAAEAMQEALAALEDDKTIHDLDRAVVYVNLGAACMAQGNRKDGLKQFDKVRALLVRYRDADTGALTGALRYNEGFALADQKDEKGQAIDVLEKYLADSDPYSAWWKLAHERYTDLCKELKRKPRDKEDLQQGYNARVRKLTSVTLGKGVVVTLAEKIEDVLKLLGPHKALPLGKDGNLKRYRFEKFPGVELLATDKVLAVILNAAKAPAVTIQTGGVGPARLIDLQVGTPRKEVLEKLPRAREVVGRNLDEAGLENRYSYYRHLSLAVRYDADYPGGKISELVVVACPD